MRFKSVTIYTSYSEYSLNSAVIEVEIPTLEEAAKILQEMDHLRLEDDDDDTSPGTDRYIKEFFTTIIYKDGKALLGAGEEEVRLIVPFGDRWYDLLSTGIEENHSEWVEMIESFFG